MEQGMEQVGEPGSRHAPAGRPQPGRPIEPRWPVLLAILFVEFLVVGLPNRFRMFPVAYNYCLTLMAVLPMLAVGLSGGSPRWLRLERRVLGLFVATILLLSVGNVWILVRDILFDDRDLSAIQLLASGVSLWVTNVVAFSLAFWYLDRGGPEARLHRRPILPDWSFPQEGLREVVRAEWRPTFIDYLFLAFSTATAFSPTGAVPLTARAMVLMMMESAISLVTIAVIAARAINILGA